MPNFETTIERPCPGTDENCCAGTTAELRTNTIRHARCFIPLLNRKPNLGESDTDGNHRSMVTTHRQHYSTCTKKSDPSGQQATHRDGPDSSAGYGMSGVVIIHSSGTTKYISA